MFDSINYAFVIALDYQDEGYRCYQSSKRLMTHFPEYAAKYSSRENAYHAYRNSEFYRRNIKAEYLVYDRKTGEILGTGREFFKKQKKTCG